MARPIGETPVLYGEEAAEFLNKMLDPPTEKHKKLSKKMKEQRFVPF